MADLGAVMLEDIAYEHHRYLEEANPLHVWRAIQCAHLAGLPYPDWVRAYLFDSASALCGLIDRPPKEVGPAVARALKFAPGGKSGAGSAFSALHNRDWQRYGAMVDRHIRAGDKPSFAWETAAQMYGISASTARRAHERYSSFIKSGLPENTDCTD